MSQHGVQLVLEHQALLLHFLHCDIADRLLVFLDAPDVLVEPMILVEKPGEVMIAGLQLMDGVLELGEFVMQVVLLQFHDAFLD